MIERQFKQLNHQFGDYQAKKFGSEVCEGYRPDLILLNSRNQPVFIIEFETTPSRKTLVGDLTKAEKFCEESKRSATLVIVLRERSNTTRKQITSHLKPYFAWFKSKGTRKAGVSNVLIITDKDYKTSVSCREALGSTEFRKRCLHLRSR